MAALSPTEGNQLLNETVSSAATYRSKATQTNGLVKNLTFVYRTTGSPVGTLILEFSQSPSDQTDRDKEGSKDGADKAVWVQYKHLFTPAGAEGHTVAINGAVTDYLDVLEAAGKAWRARYTHTSGSGTVEVTVDSRAF